jgi:hypothetical protein
MRPPKKGNVPPSAGRQLKPLSPSVLSDPGPVAGALPRQRNRLGVEPRYVVRIMSRWGCSEYSALESPKPRFAGVFLVRWRQQQLGNRASPRSSRACRDGIEMPHVEAVSVLPRGKVGNSSRQRPRDDCPGAHPRRKWRRGSTVIANVEEASWIRSTGMAVVFAALRGGLSEPKRAMEISCPRGSWRAL